MRRILGFCAILAIATPVLAQNAVPSQEPFAQQPAASTSVPNIHATGANQVTAPNTIQQGMVAGQPAATTTVPSGNMIYYYYPAGNSGYVYQTSPATVYSANTAPTYTVPTQYYYTTARRGPFGLFRRRYVQPAYTTAYTPTYYTSPGYYYVPTAYVMPTAYTTPMSYTIPATTSPAAPLTGTNVPNTATGATSPTYTPTTYNVPTETAPSGTTPSGTTPSGTTVPVPSRTIPIPPPVNPR